MAMTTMKIDLPEQLRRQLQDLVDRGWFCSEDELIREAVRRFLEAHRPELMARFVRADVEWGLKGEQ